MPRYCICLKCNEKFDRDKEAYVAVNSRRYGHASCYPDNENVIFPEKKEEKPKKVKAEKKTSTIDPTLKELRDYIHENMGTTANWALIGKQIKNYIEQGYSYSSILKTLKYFVEIEKGSLKDKNTNGGIKIVEFVVEKAKAYYTNVNSIQQTNDDIQLNILYEEIHIEMPKCNRQKLKLLDWSIDDEE